MGQDWALALLHVAQAFDSIDWPFLFQVLTKLSFGSIFIKWISIIYKHPKDAMFLNGILSSYIYLS